MRTESDINLSKVAKGRMKHSRLLLREASVKYMLKPLKPKKVKFWFK